MENPLAWNPVQKAIFDAMQEHEVDKGIGVIGGSVVYYIYTKLKREGFLKEVGAQEKATNFIEERLKPPLLHGDEKHQEWLRQELREWIPDLVELLKGN